MYGADLERGLDRVLGLDIVAYDPRRSVSLKSGLRRLQKKRVISPGLQIEKDAEADRHRAIDSICHFPDVSDSHTLPPVILQYTLQTRNLDKLERFVRLAKHRGGKHMYVVVEPGDEDKRPFYLFIAGRLLRDEVYALARDPNAHAIWIVNIRLRKDYEAIRYENSDTVIERIKRRLARRRASKTRVRGTILSIKRGQGFLARAGSDERIPFKFDDIVDNDLRLVLQNAARYDYKRLVMGLRVSFEVTRDAEPDEVRAISLLAEQDLRPLKRTLYEVFVGLGDGTPVVSESRL